MKDKNPKIFVILSPYRLTLRLFALHSYDAVAMVRLELKMYDLVARMSKARLYLWKKSSSVTDRSYFVN